MWMARDEDGKLYLYETKPRKYEEKKVWQSGNCLTDLPGDMFPEIKWTDAEPVEVVIKRKEK